ncbi:NDP-sugar synthase [Kitasatospora sp. NPDC050463]|uniref:NDP-sugar synthase n=1 Tax=Kitasatospora sp. NPDC050463 TaxID=3155786 RepID=UPI0033DAA18E
MSADRVVEQLSDVWVAMPIGGMATRARETTNDTIPKHLLRLDSGETILSTICRELQRIGFRRFVFCVGHMSDQIVEHLQGEEWVWKAGVSYVFSEERTPLGPDGAVLAAVKRWQLQGHVLMMPGDLLLPWDELAEMTSAHVGREPSMTAAVTSHLTPRTTDVGRFVVDATTWRLRHVYDRREPVAPTAPGELALTSAGAIALSTDHFIEVCEEYAKAHPGENGPLGLRDNVFPWAIESGGFTMHAHDLRGELLDLGTPANIDYGRKNWQRYVSAEVAGIGS